MTRSRFTLTLSARPRLRLLAIATIAIAAIAIAAGLARPATAQDSSQARTILVDEGGSYEVPVHPDFVTVLYLPDKVVKALASDTVNYEVKPIASTTIAIRPLAANARPANLSLATDTLHVSIILRIAASREQALTQVTFKRADVEAELQRRIDEGVRARTAALEARIAALQQQQDAALPRLADELIAGRLLTRLDVRKLGAIERNDHNVVVEVTRVVLVGDDAYLLFTLQDRDRAPYRLATAKVLDGATDRAGVVRFTGDASEAAQGGVVGIVRAGGRGTGVVMVRRAADVIGRPLTLVVAEPGGKGEVAVDRIVLR
ncbi:MAG TPA: hypothetical protein VHE35_34520 [Kofleriaceae bacterium]|nr:hypothetical protein [Kofleriaceae bacterium]